MLQRVGDRLRVKLVRAWFDRRCSAVWQLPPIECDPDSSFSIVSQLYHPDVTMYMLALNSFTRYAKPKSITIVDDGLTAADRDKLSQHVAGVDFTSSAAVHLGKCPIGGCWERLATLCRINQSGAVVQLDSDILFLDSPADAIRALRSGGGFVLGAKTGRRIDSLDVAAAFAQTKNSGHVQHAAEAVLDRYPGRGAYRYVRACAGFAGFPAGCLDFNALEKFSQNMEGLLGRELWHRWGSEQVASNFMASNCTPVSVLSPEAYTDCVDFQDNAHAVAVHFIGTCRYDNGVYLHQARRLIKALQR